MAVHGIDKLESLAKALRGLSAIDVEVGELVGGIAATEVQKTISSGRTPYGSKWPGKAPGLSRLSVVAKGKELSVRHQYAGVHQSGATITGSMIIKGPDGWRRPKKIVIPRRQLLPDKGVPNTWRPAIKRALVQFIKAKLI